jgi:hypothetical protein
VRTGAGPAVSATDRHRPKSHTLIWQSEFNSRFEGLISLCSKSAECKYFNAFNNCHMIYFLWISARIPALITACKSVSIWSNVRYISLSFSALITCWSLIIFSWPLKAWRYMISLNVLCASVAFLNASKHFFKATTALDRFSTAFQTTPYA